MSQASSPHPKPASVNDDVSAARAQIRPAPRHDPVDPLTLAVEERDQNIIDQVAAALREERVALAFQPIVPAANPARPSFYEGLMRIFDETGRAIPARQFMGQVENHRLGREIDTLALKMAMKTLRDRPKLRLSINLSAQTIEHAEWSAELNRSLAIDDSLAPRLILEITERSAIEMPEMVAEFMTELQARQISFAIDDFGSGYTSMRYLKDLYFDLLKIDGEFVRGIATSPDNAALVSAIVSIAQHFNMLTVAESVETADDAWRLGEIGVDCLQGYFFGAPSLKPRWQRVRAAG